MNNEFIKEIKNVNNDILELNKSLKHFNTLKLESSCKYLIMPTSFVELKKIFIIIKKYNVKYIVIGNGSNIVLSPKEKDCVIKLNFITSKYDCIFYASDMLMIKANEFYNKGYMGLEYLANIPASIGGAILMNAGAYSHFLSDIIEYVYFIDEDYNFKVLDNKSCGFGYRDSIFKNDNKIILGCKVSTKKGNKSDIRKIMDECKEKRKESQPIEFPNCGSVFKNKENISAWKLIEGASLKGYKRNGAMISRKHCNFIINYNNATYEDVLFLILLIKKKVNKAFKINLEEEVIIIE